MRPHRSNADQQSGIGSNSSLLPLFSLDLVRSRAERRKHHHWLNSRQSKGCRDERRPGRYRRRLERLRESSLQELSQLGPSPELRDGIQIPECRGKRVGQTPDRPCPKFLVLRLEVEVVHGPGETLRRLQLALDERLVDDHLRGDIGEYTSLPCLYLFFALVRSSAAFDLLRPRHNRSAETISSAWQARG